MNGMVSPCYWVLTGRLPNENEAYPTFIDKAKAEAGAERTLFGMRPSPALA